jgi:PAS domain S-box-containing protein
MSTQAHPHDALVLLRTEHAVVRVLAEASDEVQAYAKLLPAIGESLGWELGALWEALPETGGMRCVQTWRAPHVAADEFEQLSRNTRLKPGEGLPGRVLATRGPAWIADVRVDPNFPRALAAGRAGLHSAFCFPVRGSGGVLAAMEFFAEERREPDDVLLETVASLGHQIGQYVERRRAEQLVRESEARKSAILNAAFDCVITMNHEGRVVEVNYAAEQTFGYTANEMIGRELAELVIPPAQREAHRRGLAHYLKTGEGPVVGRRIEMTGMRHDGSEFPVELAITRPQVTGPPLFTGYLRDVTERNAAERGLRSLAEEQAALRRVATVVASEPDQQRVFAVVTEEVARLLRSETANIIRYDSETSATVMSGWSAPGVQTVPAGETVPLDSDTVATKILRSGRPERVDSYEGLTGDLVRRLRGMGFRSAVGAPIKLGGRLWGATLLSTHREHPYPRDAEERVAAFTELVAQALANAEAREQLAASRARLVLAADAERRRLERNLHDGAQQRLVGVLLSLRLAERKLASDPAQACELLERGGDELAEALEELRELAQGLHPAILTHHGLGSALQVLAARCPVPVELAAEVGEEMPEAIEAAVYYVAAETLTNVAKHANASSVRVRVSQADGRAVVEVTDDGRGGAERDGGSGLRGLADRVEALGGRLEVASPVGAGTAVRAAIPYR